MPGQQHDLHGNVPDNAPIALLLIDVINDLAFAHGKALLKHARWLHSEPWSRTPSLDQVLQGP